jgi:uncharacterized protein (TIGR00730 family)
MKRICVICGSSTGFDSCYAEMAERLGQVLADRKYELVYGGAEVGLMGRVADTVMNSGGVVIGVIPKAFAHKVSHHGLSELHIVDSMHNRKTMMYNLSDAFIALPGGFGTLDELMEILTWAQLGMHEKPCCLINKNGYFDLLLSFLDNSVRNGFIKQEHRDMLLVSDGPEEMLNKMENYIAPKIEKWVGIK